MVYAHQNIDLKPIPGIENPFVDVETVEKAKEAEKATAQEAIDKTAAERPPVLSGRTTHVLRDMNMQFRSAPPLQPTREPETLSAL
jgi:penicillin-binding protein 1A